jgi:polysaccharide pyruvyl transferase WcaK-like protein
MTRVTGKRVLIINQHGDNRGDEAAMRAMIRAINARFPGSSFIVLIQVRDLPAAMTEPEVEFRSMYLSVVESAKLAVYASLATFGIRVPTLLSDAARAIVEAYRAADVVITAPGGPYFGDSYVDHELVHWFYVYLARLHAIPVFQYAPSCGPFRIGPMNWIRRRAYRWMGVLVVREEVSKNHLQTLLGPTASIFVTTDAALQDVVPPASRESYFGGSRAYLRGRFIVAVTLQRYRFPGNVDRVGSQAAFEQAALECLEHIACRTPSHFLLFPQLFGVAGNDVSFHRYMGNRLSAGISWEIVDPALDSDDQRALFGLVDFCVASRYHPQIFATSQSVPGLFIVYEHKQLGYLHQLGLDRYAFDIREPDVATMTVALNEAIDRRSELSECLRQRIKPLRERACLTTDLLEDFASGRPLRISAEGIATRAERS